MENSDFIKAGKVSAQAKNYALSLVKEGAEILEIAKKIEQFIYDKGCKLSFPVNVSVNETAAHNAPKLDDKTKLKKGDLVKLDLGAQYNGAVTDCAVSVSVGKSDENEKLIEAARKANEEAVKMATPGTNTADIGKKIQEIIESYGFRPIRNLTGHGVGIYEVHTSPSIPNYAIKKGVPLKKGQIIAIEPFSTNGAGLVYESKNSEIYGVISSIPSRAYSEVLNYIKKEFKTLPFSKRHIIEKFGKLKASIALKSFLVQKIIQEYPILKEKEKGKVAQWENTVIVDNKPKVLTH